jgi:hypothetical protein
MKKLITNICSIFLAGLILVSCKKDENQVVFEGGDAPVLSANKTGAIPMSFLTKDEEAIRLDWTNPNYRFNSGISSQDVTYTVEIDTAGINFGSSNIKRVAISKELSVSFTQSQMNDFMLNQLNLNVNVTYTIQMRVIASLTNDNGKVVSNVLEFTARAYTIPPKVTPPGTAPDYTDGRLFLVGSATPGGWANPVPTPSQEFTKISSTLYEIVVPMSGGGSYLFLPINGFWGAKYGGLGANNTNNVMGDDFKPEGGDMLAPSSSGTYKITVDFQRGKFTLVQQ